MFKITQLIKANLNSLKKTIIFKKNGYRRSLQFKYLFQK